MVKLTKEDENKLGQILKELNEMKDVLKGGEGSGKKGHKQLNKFPRLRYSHNPFLNPEWKKDRERQKLRN